MSPILFGSGLFYCVRWCTFLELPPSIGVLYYYSKNYTLGGVEILTGLLDTEWFKFEY